ncbi:31272_t:CDS:2 [Gigaspora margarita]|uniref:31272_t:CDS:1 n=1 Tax=Gigaspora margarita TaxID=4874 RepID=A0ABN7UJA4_GIGMA|nr:31272_t:CDS:2 [Gigaspora margarita]
MCKHSSQRHETQRYSFAHKTTNYHENLKARRDKQKEWNKSLINNI